MSFSKYILKFQKDFDTDILPLLKVKLNIVKLNSRNKIVLIYDNRFLSFVEPGWPEICWILNKREKIIKEGNFSICVPFSEASTVANLPPEESLCDLLSGSQTLKFKNPNNFKETLKIIKRNKLEAGTLFSYFWKIVQKNKRMGQAWIRPLNGQPAKLEVEAFLKPDYTVGFRRSTKYLDTPLLPSKKEKKEREKKQDTSLPPDEFQKNCSSSVSSAAFGLNLLFDISALTLEQFQTLSVGLGDTAAVLWIDLDSDSKARFATYKDSQLEQQIELATQKDWKRLFDLIYKQREKILQEKTSILDPAVSYLKQVTKEEGGNAFKKCLNNLNACIKNSKLLVYSKDDSVLHSLKTQFCYYLVQKKKKGFRGITLNGDSTNNLTTLKTADLTIFNFFNYFELEENSTDFLPPPTISGDRRLQRQPAQANQQSTLAYVKRRGTVQARQLLLAWRAFGKMFLQQFGFDIFSVPLSSLSNLSFKSVWRLYTRLGGFYQHGLETAKEFDQDMLRSHCHGGFSFSALVKREVGEPLIENPSEECKNIQGCDIRSSYGFACSQMSAVKGFCTSYKWSEEASCLVRCDRFARFKSFEFQSVFFTIHQLETRFKVNIKTIYSNFHQSGIFSVKNYPLDLTVVTEEGHLLLFNMDGDYAHGCRAGCPDLRSYVRNKERRELEIASQERDDYIRAWCSKMNAALNNDSFCNYFVKTNCHDSAYGKSNLARSFQSEPVLSNLISHSFQSNKLTLDDVLFCSEDLTFLAVVEGFVPDSAQNPLLVRDENRSWNRSSRTPEGGVFITRDYLKWMINQLNFRVTNIPKVWIYKKCNLFNDIFRGLIDKRALDETSLGEKEFLKKVVNFCSGYFGLNENKSGGFVSHRLVTNVGENYDICSSSIQQLDPIEKVNFAIIRKTGSQRKRRKNFNSALQLYCLITEFGKMTLSKAMCHFEKCLSKEKFSFVYSHIDNLVMILSVDKIEEAVRPHLKTLFEETQKKLFGTRPGQLKKEFEYVSADGWRFVTGMVQNFALLTNNDPGIHKSSGWKEVSSEASYENSCKILKKEQVFIQQKRRVDKMFSLETVTKMFCY